MKLLITTAYPASIKETDEVEILESTHIRIYPFQRVLSQKNPIIARKIKVSKKCN
jgi:hypothetical protein